IGMALCLYGIAKTSVLERILHCKTQSRPRRVTAVVGTGCTIRSTRGSRRHNRSSVAPTKVLHEGVTGSRHELDFHARNHSSGPAGGTAQRAPGAPARQRSEERRVGKECRVRWARVCLEKDMGGM